MRRLIVDASADVLQFFDLFRKLSICPVFAVKRNWLADVKTKLFELQSQNDCMSF